MEFALGDFMFYEVFQGANEIVNLLKPSLLKELNEVLRIDILHLDDSGVCILLEFKNLRNSDMLILLFCRGTLFLGLESKASEVLGVGCGFVNINPAVLIHDIYLTA